MLSTPNINKTFFFSRENILNILKKLFPEHQNCPRNNAGRLRKEYGFMPLLFIPSPLTCPSLTLQPICRRIPHRIRRIFPSEKQFPESAAPHAEHCIPPRRNALRNWKYRFPRSAGICNAALP